jgi:hypothetical protein
MRLDSNFLHRVGRRIIHARVSGRIVEVRTAKRELVHVPAATVNVHGWPAAGVAQVLRGIHLNCRFEVHATRSAKCDFAEHQCKERKS